jgi:hypothetical protein
MTGDGEDSDESNEAIDDDPLAGMYAQEGSESHEANVPEVGAADEEPETTTGTFYVKHVEESAVTLHEVETKQIVTLVENPDFEVHEIIEASLVAQPPMQVSYRIGDMAERWTIPVETSPEPPTTRASKVAGELDQGDAIAIEREGEGEIHILNVPVDHVEQTAEELLEDEMTYKNAARYGVERVEIRTDEDEGVVTIRYLP